MDSLSNVSTNGLTALIKPVDQGLNDEKISETRICPERHENRKDCFDDMISELTNIDPEQGALVSLIRDEFSIASDCHKKLYESSVCFGLSKAIAAKHQNEKLHARIDEILEEKMNLLDENEYLKRKLNTAKTIEGEQREQEVVRLEHGQLKNLDEQNKRALATCMLTECEEISNVLVLDGPQ
jgi:dynein light intermediate chain